MKSKGALFIKKSPVKFNPAHDNAKSIPANSESKIEMDHRGRNTYFVKTTSFPSSFFQMEADDVEEIVEDKLQHVEKNIVKLCTDVQARLDSSA